MIRKFYLSIIFILSFTFVFSQSIEIQRGDAHFEFFQFKEAVQDYEAALKYYVPSSELYLYDRLSQSCKYSFQYKKAEEYFSKLIRLGDKSTNPDVYLDFAAILKITGQYARARDQYRYYLTLFPDDIYANAQLKSLSWAEKFKDSLRNFTVLPTNLDIAGQSLGYCFFENGLVYSASKNKIGKDNSVMMYDLDFAEINDSVTFVEGEKYMDEISFETNEGSPSVSDDGMLIYFTANAMKFKSGIVTKKIGNIEISSDGVSNLKIYVARYENGKFVNPQELPFNNKEYNCTHPCITGNGNTLYFASDMPKGFGGMDLYKVIRGTDGKWGKPENLGASVNTTENEMWPFVMNNVLFFASKGFNGFGGYDLFQSKINLGIPTAPVNMGKPFNSSHDDVAFICRPDGRTGYISSNRDNDEGTDKVYYFMDNAFVHIVTKPVIASAEKTEKKVEQVVKKVEPPPVIAQKRVIENKPKTEPAKPFVKIIQKDTTPKIVVTKLTPEKKIQQPKKATDDELTKISFGKVIFKFNDASIPPSSYVALDSAIKISRISKSVKIEINAHTDCRGTNEYNQKLSDRRAATAKNYLLKKGVSASRIITHGFGETKLLNNCSDGVDCTEEQHAVNRRVEIRIVK